MISNAQWKKMTPTIIPAPSASAIFTTRLRSSRMWSMSGMRPSGFCCRWECTNFSPTIRAPWMAPGSFAIAASLSYLFGTGLAGGLLGPLSLGRGRVHGGRPLQVTDLLLQRVDLGLLGRWRRGGELGRRERGGRGTGGRRLGLGRLKLGLILVQAAHLGLQDAHRFAQGTRRVRQLLRPE